MSLLARSFLASILLCGLFHGMAASADNPVAEDQAELAVKFVMKACNGTAPCGITDPVTENVSVTLKLVSEDANGNSAWQGTWMESEPPFLARVSVTKFVYEGKPWFEIYSDLIDSTQDFPFLVKVLDLGKLQYTVNYGAAHQGATTYFAALAVSASH